MLTPQGRLHDTQPIVRRHAHGKTKQSRPGIGQRINLALQYGRQLLKAHFNGPALAIGRGNDHSLHRLRQIRQDVQLRVPITGRLIELQR